MNSIKTKVDIVYNENTKKDIIIAHFADIHFSKKFSNKKLNKLEEKINQINPNYVIISGDLIDDYTIINDKVKIKELVSFLTSIGAKRKVIISLGNHDIINEEDFKFFRKLNDLYNIYVLDNSFYQDECVYVAGFTLPTEYYYNIMRHESPISMKKVFEKHSDIVNKIPRHLPKIALIHSPIVVATDEMISNLKEYDLILCGHTHGGMVPNCLGFIFKNRGIVAPNKRILPSIARGKIEKNVNNKIITIIINSGITRLSLRSGKILSNLNFLYSSSINKIIIRKERRINYE